jgi:hypothetical protein
MGYTPAFDSIYTGTLFGRWPMAAVWGSLIPLIDPKGQINFSYEALAGMIGWPMDLLRQGIAQLMEPDPGSRSEAEDGRRLVPIDPTRGWGWRVVNHALYREKARKQFHNQQAVESGANRERMQTRRDQTRPGTTDSQTQTQTQTKNQEKTTTAAARPTRRQVSRETDPEWLLDFKLAYPERSGSQPWRRAIAAAHARVGEGHSTDDFIAGARRYAAYCEATGKVGSEYVLQAATFLGPDRPFLRPWHPPPKAENASERILRKLNGPDDRVIDHENQEPLAITHR